jgi:aspartate aminotransferase
MPTPSERSHRVPASPIRRLVPFANAARARGVHVHHLNIGQPDIETPRPMIEAYRSYDDAVLAYGPSEGLPALREGVAAYFDRVGDPVEAHQVFVTTGGSEALAFALAATTSPGDAVLVPEPFYANYAGFAAMLGTEIIPVLTDAEGGFHLPPDTVLDAAVTPRTRAFLFANPGNPTGAVYTAEELGRIGQLAERHDLFVIADEVYREFVYDADQGFTSALSLPCASERVIVTDSVSKRFSACGARVGFAVSRVEAICDALLRLSFARLCPATVDQLAAVQGYALPPSFFDPIIETYRNRRDVLVEGLNSIDGVHTYRPEGAFYTVVTLPVEDSDDFCRWLLTDFDHQGETVMMAPATGFYGTAGLGRQQARIAYVLEVGALQRSVEILRAGLAQYRLDR